MQGQWYITISALRQFMELAGYRGEPEDTNPDFLASERELIDATGFSRDTGRLTDSGAMIHRTGNLRLGPNGRVRGRLEFTVSPTPRREGDRPQLIRVRLKGL